ncbi:MAG: translation initiation factor IF-2 subunit beta [Candidatus Undinarchaeales archaeon]|jgi:translation initiation factor 2 subunit 2|nr:translation initiation factor IF-2 subunit beta [Candidatus Undinarchaeales archaeon]
MTTEDEYKKLLNRAREGLPDTTEVEVVRFEMPKFESFIEGNQTLIKNFTEVARTLERDTAHLQKYLALETGSRGELEAHRLRLKTAKNNAFLNQKLATYVNEFVICKECKKPDTELRMVEGVPWIKCRACSAKYPIRKI